MSRKMVTTSSKLDLPEDVCAFRRKPEDFLSEVVPVWRSKAHLSGNKWSKLDTRLQHFYKCTQFRDTKNNISKCFATRKLDRDFIRHLKDNHLNDVLYCIYCYPRIDELNDYKNVDEVKLLNHESLVKHLKQCHQFRKFQCNQCLYRAVSVDHVNIHQSVYHTKNYGLFASIGRECKILECETISTNTKRMSEYFKEYGVERVALRELYQCVFCEFANKDLTPVIDHCVNHADYPIMFYSPKRKLTTTEITVARDDSSEEECQVLEDGEHTPSTTSVKKMQDNRVTSTSRLLNASKERLKLFDRQKANRDRVLNRFKQVGSYDRNDGTSNKNALHNIRMNASKGNTLQKLHQRIKDQKTISVTSRNIRHKNRNKLDEKRSVHRHRNKLVESRIVNRGKLVARYSGSSSDEDEGVRRAKSDQDSKSESEQDENCVKISDDSDDSVVRVRHSSPEPSDSFICIFCDHTMTLKIRCISHIESHFAELDAFDPNYKKSKRVDRWIRGFVEKQNDLAIYENNNTPVRENHISYQCPICVKLANTRGKKAKNFRNFWEVRNHFWTHMAWYPVSCRICDSSEEFPNCDTIINKHLNSVHQNILINSESGVINQLLGDKMRNSYTYRQRKAVENHFIDVHHDPVIDDFIKKQLDGIIVTREKNLRILNKFPEELPSISISRLPGIDYNNENSVKKYLEAVKICESRVNTLIQENRSQMSSDDSDNSNDERNTRQTISKAERIRMYDEMVAFMNSLTPERPVGCGRCKHAFRDLLDHNKQRHSGMAMMPIRKNY